MSEAKEVREEIRLESVCDCGARREETFSHVVRNGRRSVHISTYCPSCGARQEGDSSELPQHGREAILREQGTWGLSVPRDAISGALIVLRKAMNLSLAQLSEMKQRTGPITTGTRVEMSFLSDLLRANGIEAEVQLASGSRVNSNRDSLV